MAKLTYSKLAIKETCEPVELSYNGNVIEVKPYLPVDDKLKIVGAVCDIVIRDGISIINLPKMEMALQIEAIKAYTNITFTDKQLESVGKVYDNLYLSGILHHIFEVINEDYEIIESWCTSMVKELCKYRNSFVGMLDAAKTDYDDASININTITDQLQNPETLGLVKDILTKLG